MEPPPLHRPPAAAAYSLPWPARALLIAVVGTAAGVFAFAVADLSTQTPGWSAFLALLPLAAAAQLFEIETPHKVSIAPSATVLIAIAILLPPELAVLAGSAALVGRGTRPRHQVAFSVANLTLAMTAASNVARMIGLDSELWFVLAGTAATASFALVNDGLPVLMIRAATERAARVSWSVAAAAGSLGALGVVVAWLWQTNAYLVPFALVALGLVVRALRVPRLEAEARLDPKTGLLNARAFQHAFRREIERAGRFRRPLALLLADLDFLREINNRHGHLAGDAVLVGIADVFRSQLRRVDAASRFGGEEFCIALPETTVRQAVEIAERIRTAVADHVFEGGLRATLSLGVATFPSDGATVDGLIGRADEALYAAKAAGRNCVRCAAEEPVAA